MTKPRSTGADYPAVANHEVARGGRHVGIVLLHGLGGDLGQLRDCTAGVVAGRPGTRLAADARQHGKTHLAEPGTMTFDILAKDVTALAARVALPGPRILIGMSMGAGTAVRIALNGDQDLRGLVLIRPAWDGPHPPNLAAMPVIAQLLDHYGALRGQDVFRAHPVYLDVVDQSLSAAASLLDQFVKPWAVERRHRLIDMPADTPFACVIELGAVDVPTLVVAAPRDPLHPIEIADIWADRIPGARQVLLTARDADPERHRRDLRRFVDAFLATL